MSYNRIKPKEYLEIVSQTKFVIVLKEIQYFFEDNLEILRNCKLNIHFREMSKEELLDTHL